MDPEALFGPLFAMMGLTFVVWTFMYVRRISFIRARALTPEELAIPGRLAEVSPADVSNSSDNLKNLFEMPVLFYATLLGLHATGDVDALDVGAGWAYVGLRCLHSAVHCTVNRVMVRFYLYAASSVVLWALIARTALRQLAG